MDKRKSPSSARLVERTRLSVREEIGLESNLFSHWIGGSGRILRLSAATRGTSSSVFLARRDYQVLKTAGWKVASKDGDFDLPVVDVYPDIESLPPADVVLLCLKSTSNHEILPHLAKTIKPGGVLVVMENGFGIEEQVARSIGADRVMGHAVFCVRIRWLRDGSSIWTMERSLLASSLRRKAGRREQSDEADCRGFSASQDRGAACRRPSAGALEEAGLEHPF